MNHMLEIAPALLEGWMRDYYFDAEIDLGSSGVESYTLREVLELCGSSSDELEDVLFNDSQTLGGRELRRVIAERYGDGNPEGVIATHGSSEAIYLIMMALLRPGDEVVVLDPCYQQLFSIAESLGCGLKKWPLRFEEGFVPNVEEARRLIGANTRMVVVNFPHNPTGASLTPDGQRELVEAAARVGAYLVWDAAFGEITYGDPPLPYPTHYERAVTMGTFSKAFGLPGLRAGWCVTSPPVLARFIALRDYTTLHLSPLTELIATRAVEHAPALVGPRLRQARTNLQLLGEWCEEHADLVEWVAPRGGVSCFPRLRRVDDVEAFCRRLAHERRVLLVPGSCFRLPSHVRLGFGEATHKFAEGLARLSASLKAASAALINS